MTPQRTPVLFDPGTSGLRIGEHERRVADPSQPSQVCAAYLSLLYAVRRAEPGEQLALRSADLEALRLLVGDDPETLEQRLIGLMGCSPQEARVLRDLLLRTRRATATLGIAAGLSLGTLGVVTQVADEEPVASAPAAAAPSTASPVALPFVGPVAAPAPAPVAVPPAPAPAAPAAVTPATGTVVLAAPAPVRRAVAPPAPAAVVEVVEAAVEVVEVVEAAPEPAAYELPLQEAPVMDAPPPVEEPPASAIGDPAVLDLEDVPLTEIGGVTDSDSAEPEALAPVVPVETVVVEPAPAAPPQGISPPLLDTVEETPAATV